MRRGFPWGVASLAFLLLAGFAAGVVDSPNTAVDPPVAPDSSGTQPKFHVVEVFTGTWCPPCANADPALSRLTDEYRDNSVFLFWHCCTNNPASGNYDPYWSAGTYDVRRNFYVPGSFGIPTVFFDGGGEYPDGTLVDVGAGTSPASYDTYRIEMEDFVDTSSNTTVDVVGDLSPGGLTVRVTVTMTDPGVQSNLALRIAVYEDAVYYLGTNGAPFHRNVVLDFWETPPAQTFTMTQGQTREFSQTFTVQPTWAVNKLGVAAWIQRNTKRTVTSGGYQFTISDIVNGDKHDLVPRGVLLYRDQGTTSDYTEIYEKILSMQNEHFETWNARVLGSDTGATDNRGLPSASEVAEFPLVVWATGAVSSAVLTQAERDLLAGHINAEGSLLITGSGIAGDAYLNYRTWFQTYLHANYVSDDTGSTYVNGVSGDPISGDFASVNLNILTSPDRVPMIPAPGVAEPFKYPGNLPGAVSATHDANSRVLYMGFRYFENTADINRGQVMTKILDWMDGASPPHVDVLFPDGGETLAQGAQVDIRWYANDVRVPANGVDIYFNDNYPTGTWQLLGSNEPNDGVFRWTVPNLDSAACRIRVVVRDSSPSSPDGEALSDRDFICGSVPYFQVTFTSADLGWHLMSHPMVLGDTSVASVLRTIAGSHGVVRWYDASDPADPWKSYDPAKPSNDLAYIDNTIGFWIQITQPCTLQVMGSRPTSPTAVSLRAGWNLVGFPSMSTTYTVARLKADTGATRVEAFDGTAAPYYLRVAPDTETLRAGNGYWVYVPADTVWMVPPA